VGRASVDTGEPGARAVAADVATDSPPASRPRRSRLLELPGMFLAYLALTPVYLLALRTSGHSFYQDVLVNGYSPDRDANARFLLDGVLPTWTRDLYGGAPYIANLQHAYYYPLNASYLFLPPSTAVEVVVATSVALAAAGMFAYCRYALRAGFWGCTLAGLAFGFSGVTLQHVILTNQLQVIAWMPWVMLAAHLALERRGLRWVVLTAVAIGLQLLAGHPEEWVYTLGAVGLYALVWTFAAGRSDVLRRAGRAAVRIGGSVGLFVCLFGWQLFPTLLLRSQGYRTASSFRDQFPLPKAIAVNSLLPDYGTMLYGENVGFVGVAVVGLAALGLARRRVGLGWVQVYLVVLGAFGFVMALGLQNPLYRFLYENVSVVAGFRVPSRYLMLTTFALCAAAALGTDALLHATKGRLGTAARALAVVVAGGVGVLLLGDITTPGASLRWWALAAGVGAVCYLAAGVRAVPRAALALTLLATTAVELREARPRAEYRQVAVDRTYDDYGPVVGRIVDEGGRFLSIARLPSEGGTGDPIPVEPGWSSRDADYFRAGFQTRVIARPNAHLGPHAETIIGRDGGLLPLRTYSEFFTAATGGGGSIVAGFHPTPPSGWRWETLDFLGVRWFVTNPLPEPEQQVLRSHGFEPVERYAFAVLWRRPAPPLVRVIGDVVVEPDAADRIELLKGSFPLQRRAIVEEPVDVDPGATGTVSSTEVELSSVRAHITSTGRALVVLSDPWYPQWRAYVDGEPAELVRVDHAFRGVVVPAGNHEVLFRYEDDRHRNGVVLAGLTVLVLVGSAVAPRVLARRQAVIERGDRVSEAALRRSTSQARLRMELVVALVRKDLRVKYQSSALGFLWSMANPLVLLCVYYFVFSYVLRTGIPDFAFYLLPGLLVWNAFATALLTASGSVVGNANLVKKLRFETAVLPLSAVGYALVHLLLQLGVLLAVLALFHRESFGPQLVMVVPATVVLLLISMALAMLVSALTVRYRDVSHLLEVVLLGWFWLNPVIYSMHFVRERLEPRGLMWVYFANPMASVVTTFQRAFYGDPVVEVDGTPTRVLAFEGYAGYFAVLGVSAAAALVLLALGRSVFRRMQGDFAEDL
jgi:ABC-2 type transport system permease protein